MIFIENREDGIHVGTLILLDDKMFRNYSHDVKSPTGRHVFEIHGVDVSIINGLRRTILTDIPVVGFSGEDEPTVDIHENNGPLHNEIISHRIGLIPIHFSEEETEAFTADDWRFELAPPKNTTDTNQNITTHHFKVTKNERELPEKEVYRLFPVNAVSKAPILITRLRPGESLHLTAVPTKNTARFHASFAPVSLCTLSYLQDPAVAATKTNVLDKERSFFKNEYGDATAVMFELEPEMALSPKYLVHKALELLIEKLAKIPALLQTDPDPTVEHPPIKIQPAPHNKGIQFEFDHEDDTLGNLLQSYLHQRYIRDANNTPAGDTVTYVGYYCPHPLDPTMILRMTLAKDASADSNANAPSATPYVDILSDACRAIQLKLQEVQNEWVRFTADT